MIRYQPIGTLHTPFTAIEGMPIQPCSQVAAVGHARIAAAYVDGLQGLEGMSHLILLYHLHRQMQTQLTVRPFLDPTPRGVFATRSPARPNPIGLSIVRLLGIDGDMLHLDRLDMLDGTPLLDIKPYVPAFDRIDQASAGWFDRVADPSSVRSDGRFAAAAAVKHTTPPC